MLNEILGITLIFFSFSFRTPFIEEAQLDYELKGGFESEKCKASVLWERENDIHGIGVDLWYNLPVNIKLNNTMLNTEFEWYNRSVKEINYQSARATYPVDLPEAHYEFGFCLNADHWQDVMLLASMKINMQDWWDVTVETDFKSRDIVSLYIGREIKVTDNVYLNPFLLYKMANRNTFCQFKTEVKYKL